MKMLEGRKTYFGIIVTAIGFFGLTKYVSPAETEQIVQLLTTLVGFAITIYGRAVAKP